MVSMTGAPSPLLSGLPQALCFTNQTYLSSKVRKIAYVIPRLERGHYPIESQLAERGRQPSVPFDFVPLVVRPRNALELDASESKCNRTGILL